MAQIDVKDAAGNTQTVAKVTNTGSAGDSDSLPVALSAEAKAQLGALSETAPASDTASSGINGRLQRIAQRLTSLLALLPVSLGAKAAVGSLSVAPATDVGWPQGAPRYAAATIVSVTTSATGSTFVALPSQACTALDLVNTSPTAVDIEVRRGGSGSTIIVPAGTSRMFVAIANASELQARRQDMANGTVTVTGEALS